MLPCQHSTWSGASPNSTRACYTRSIERHQVTAASSLTSSVYPDTRGILTVTPGSTITRRCFDPVMSVSKVETHLHFVSWRRVLRSLVAPIRDFSAIVYDNLRSYWLLRLRSIFSTFLMRIAPPSQNGSFLFQGDWQNLRFTTIIFFRSGLGSNVLTCRYPR